MPRSPQVSEIELTQLILTRLERLSVDSHWARRAGGLRASLLKALQRIEAGEDVNLTPLLERGLETLNNAAREIPTHKTIK